ncbi:MAG: CDP-alcohol phosphatidyltransferase family protein [Planctomycetes bacterium]|nr:CDP-alcohol phosphatidyltransferase family protein [Planctomycetota bacterium]
MRKRRPIFNLPNCLTLSRFVFAPIMLWLILNMADPGVNRDAWKITLAILILLIIALLTDLFDGWTARQRKEVTQFGKIMDPVADSTFFMTLLFALSACDRFGESVSLWFPMLVLYREIAIQILRRYAALKGNAVPAKMSGKIKMFTQSVLTAFFFLLVLIRDMGMAFYRHVWISENFLHNFVLFLALYTVAVNYWSLIEYSRDVPELVAEYIGQGEQGGDDAADGVADHRDGNADA